MCSRLSARLQILKARLSSTGYDEKHLSTMSILDKNFAFHANAADSSFVGIFEGVSDATFCMSEHAIAEYIRSSRPELYQRLNRLPVATFEILEDFDTHGNHRGRNERALEHNENYIPTFRQTYKPRQLLKRHDLPTIDVLRGSPQQRLLDLQHKRYLQHRLQDGCYLLLQRATRLGSGPCSLPLCFNQHLESRARRYCLSLEPQSAFSDNPQVTQRVFVCYDLECIEHLFEASQPLRTLRASPSPYLSSDGDATADRLSIDMPRNAAQISAPDPRFAFNHPPNSSEAYAIRQEKSREIQEILDHVAKREVHLSPVQQHDGNNLRLRRRRDLSPEDERYKKQGLTRYAKQKERKLQLRLVRVQEETNHMNVAASQQIFTPRICYCRESQGDEEVVMCSGNSCQIGVFHLGCCQIDQIPAADERFYCCYCAENLGVIDREAVVYGVPDETNAADDQNEAVEDNEAPQDHTQSITETRESDAEPGPLTGSTLVGDDQSPSRTMFLQTDGHSLSHKTLATNTSNRLSLPQDNHHTTFRDLAQFIEADSDPTSPYSIPIHAIRRLESWKTECFRSKCAEAATTQSGAGSGFSNTTVNQPDGSESQSKHHQPHSQARLSQVLNTI